MSRLPTFILFVALSLSGRSAAQDAMARYYPARAQRLNVEGMTRIHCHVTTEDRLSDCLVLDENPSGYGFGASAVAMAEHELRLAPRDKNGVLVAGGNISIGIKWRLPSVSVPSVTDSSEPAARP